jgi:hypothetical protein
VDAMLVKVVVAGVLGAHGVGHVMGWMPALGLAHFDGVSGSSWLLTGTLGDGATRLLAVGLFAVPTVGFVAAAVGLLLGQPWWRPLAVASAGVSLAATAIYPQALPTGSAVGSVAINVIVLCGVLVADWGASTAGA